MKPQPKPTSIPEARRKFEAEQWRARNAKPVKTGSRKVMAAGDK